MGIVKCRQTEALSLSFASRRAAVPHDPVPDDVREFIQRHKPRELENWGTCYMFFLGRGVAQNVPV
jgi:hypothetical protein